MTTGNGIGQLTAAEWRTLQNAWERGDGSLLARLRVFPINATGAAWEALATYNWAADEELLHRVLGRSHYLTTATAAQVGQADCANVWYELYFHTRGGRYAVWREGGSLRWVEYGQTPRQAALEEAQ